MKNDAFAETVYRREQLGLLSTLVLDDRGGVEEFGADGLWQRVGDRGVPATTAVSARLRQTSQWNGTLHPCPGVLLQRFRIRGENGVDTEFLTDFRTGELVHLRAPPRWEPINVAGTAALPARVQAELTTLLREEATIIEELPRVEPFRGSHGTAATALLEYWGLRRAGEPLRVLAGTYASFATRCLCDDPLKPIVWELKKGFAAFAGQRRRNLAVEETVARTGPGGSFRIGFDDYRRCIDNRTPPLLTFLYGDENQSDTWARYRLNGWTVLGAGYLESGGNCYIITTDYFQGAASDGGPGYAVYRWDDGLDNLILLTLQDEEREPQGRLTTISLGTLLQSVPQPEPERRSAPAADTFAGQASAETFAIAPASTTEPGVLAVHYFFDLSCKDCIRVERLLDKLRAQYPRLQVSSYNLKEPENISLLVGYYQAHQIPPERWQGTLVVFSGDTCYLSYDEIAGQLAGDIESQERNASSGCAGVAAADRGTMEQIFSTFTVATIAAAGLADGINPCAFGVLIFFFTYLRAARKEKKALILTGLTFTAGVFLAYFLLGLGCFEALYQMRMIGWLARLLYPAVTVLTLGLTVYTWFDYRNARRGETEAIRLKLPAPVQRLIQWVIRYQVRLRWFVPFAFVTGMVVSLLELACTGQIYFPVLLYIAGVPELRAQVAGWLLLYVTMFIIPLVVVFIGVYLGTTSVLLAGLTRRTVAPAKLALLVVLALLTGYLVSITVQLY